MFLFLTKIQILMTEQEVVKSITYNGDELTSLQESLESYLGILTFNYMNWLMAVSQSKQMKDTLDDEQKKQLDAEVKKVKDDLIVLDMAIPRVKGLLLKLNEVLGIDKQYETAEEILTKNWVKLEDEADTTEWTGEVQDDAADNKSEAEVSESA